MHTNCFIFQYFSDKTFKSSIKLFYAEILTVITTIYRPVFLYKLSNPYGMPTFNTKVLRLVSNVQLVKQLLL